MRTTSCIKNGRCLSNIRSWRG